MDSRTMRVTLGTILLIVGLAAGWFGHRVLNGAADIPTISLYDDWRLACPPTSQKDASCEMQQNVLDAKTRSELARLAIFRLQDDDTLVITVPFNVLLEPGVGLAFGKDKPLVFPYETCNSVRCVGRIKLDEALRTSIGSTTEARVHFAGLDGKPVGLPFSSKGFNAAASAFSSAEGKRRSWWRRLWS